jgi:hypothetical protein
VQTLLDPIIINRVRNKFEENCYKLLLDAHAKIPKGTLIEFSENNITLEIVRLMKTDPLSDFYKIDITREFYLDNTSNADESDRIDLRFMNWKYPEKFEYFMEAKNLSENDWKKKTGSKVSHQKYLNRYITTGVDNFISGKYSKGCLVGFVVNGNAVNVIAKLNTNLSHLGRATEHLAQDATNVVKYVSRHSTSLLNHIMLEL